MKHLNPYRFYELASKLHALFNNATHNRVADMFAPLTEAQNVLDLWIKGDVFKLESSKEEANRLLDKISAIFSKYYIDQDTKQIKAPTGEDRIDPQQMSLVYSLLEKFEHALAAELNHAPAYMATKRGIYSTYDLIENAQESFSEDLRRVMPGTSLTEFDMAGRSLAFGMGTAATLHLLRAVELVLKRYFEIFSDKKVERNERSYAIYLKKLASIADKEKTDNRPNKRLLQMLAQIKEHYRNPLTMSGTNISIDQAVSLFGIATAAMTLMSEEVLKGKNNGKSAEAALDEVAKAAAEDDDSVVEDTKKKAG